MVFGLFSLVSLHIYNTSPILQQNTEIYACLLNALNISVQISFCVLFFFSPRKVRAVAYSGVLRRSIINLAGLVELLPQLEPHSAPGGMTLHNCDSALCRRCICWGYKNTTDAHSSKSSCSSKRTAAMRLLCKMLKRRREKNKALLCSPSWFLSSNAKRKPKKNKKQNGTLCFPTRHKGPNIFSTLPLYIFYSARCLFASSLCSLTMAHTTATLRHDAKCLFPDLQICCRDEGQFGRVK